MNANVDIIGLVEAPKVLSKNEYSDLLVAFRTLGHENLLVTAYKQRLNDDSYDLVKSSNQLWKIYCDVNRDKWIGESAISIVATYIYDHRIKFGRIGNEIDDYIKAQYLVDLVSFLNRKRSVVIQLQQDDEMEVIIDQVNNIFDSAYFKKLNIPGITDADCFYEAEREFCRDKAIDFIEHQTRHCAAEKRHDFKRRHEHEEISFLARQYYDERINRGEPGDEKTDWEKAERQYPHWLFTKRIAMTFWNNSPDKYQHQDYYWFQADRIVNILDKWGINYVDATLTKLCI